MHKEVDASKKWVDNEKGPVARPVPTGLNKELIYNEGWVINKNDGKKRRVGFVGA